jgi:hypothetical protein
MKRNQKRLSRRDFCRNLALTSAVLPVGSTLLAGTPAGKSSTSIENEFFFVTFDAASGRFDIRRRKGEPLISGAVVRANTSEVFRVSSQSAYRHTIRTQRIRDHFSDGHQLTVHSTDTDRQLDFNLHLTLYANLQAVVIEATCKNISGKPLVLKSLEPMALIDENNGALHWPQTTKILTNGQMYSDPGSVADISQATPEPWRSWWNIGFFSGYRSEGLVCGYLRNQVAQGQVTARREKSGAISLTAESVLADGFVLESGGEISSEPFMLNISPDPYTALETYAAMMGKLQSARVSSVINGWCSWFYTFEHVTEEEVLRNAEFAARELKPFGLEYIQVDEGFQRWHGEWEGNEKFPHGMKWLADRIRGMGLKPGIWLAPYIISEPTKVFQKHPDWLLRHPDERLKRVGPWPSEDSDWAKNENPKRYCLDITHPEAAAWLANLFDTVANQWGYEMIKIDFVGWSLLSAERFYDPTMSPAAAYRKGFEIMRRSIGDKCHLQDCGPGPVTVGLLDSMRIELDQNYGFRRDTWRQYFTSTTGSAAAAAKRYYFHKRTWINDADHVCLNLLSLSQAQAAASLLALTGGNLLSGDRLPDLDPARLDILKKIYPSSGEAARPVDLFDTDEQTVFAIKIKRSFDEWTVVGIFNPDEYASIERVLPLERLWLDPQKSYIVYDFWQERLHGLVEREVSVTVPPTGVTLLALHEKQGRPQVISTDRHVLQGALELENANWDEERQTLAGISLGPLGTAHNIAVYIPEPQQWVQGGPFLFHDFPGYTLKMMDEHILRVRVRFDQEKRVAWKINMKENLG